MNKVFFSNELNDYVVDALCACGHLERDHGSQLKPAGHKKVRLPHDGSCCVGRCPCPKFRWVRWVTATGFFDVPRA